jgi:type IV secretory pathway component VirB8
MSSNQESTIVNKNKDTHNLPKEAVAKNQVAKSSKEGLAEVPKERSQMQKSQSDKPNSETQEKGIVKKTTVTEAEANKSNLSENKNPKNESLDENTKTTANLASKTSSHVNKSPDSKKEGLKTESKSGQNPVIKKLTTADDADKNLEKKLPNTNNQDSAKVANFSSNNKKNSQHDPQKEEEMKVGEMIIAPEDLANIVNPFDASSAKDNLDLANSIAKKSTQELTESNIVKQKVADGSYFVEARNWYFIQYVSPIVERAMLFIAAIISFMILYYLYEVMQMAFPLVEKKPIFVRSLDQSQYHIYLENLKPHKRSAIDRDKIDPRITNNNEAIVKKLVSQYVVERESFDYRDSNIQKVKTKFNKIRNTSSVAEYEKFQAIMDGKNPDSPIGRFGADYRRKVIVSNVTLQKQRLGNLEKLVKQANITDAIVSFSTVTKTSDDDGYYEIKEDYRVNVKFTFGGIREYNKSRKYSNQEPIELKFIVEDYQLFRIKKSS